MFIHNTISNAAFTLWKDLMSKVSKLPWKGRYSSNEIRFFIIIYFINRSHDSQLYYSSDISISKLQHLQFFYITLLVITWTSEIFCVYILLMKHTKHLLYSIFKNVCHQYTCIYIYILYIENNIRITKHMQINKSLFCCLKLTNHNPSTMCHLLPCLFIT